MCQQRVSQAASVRVMRKKRAGSTSIARRSRARSHASEVSGSGRTLHGNECGAERRERQQRLAARHTREHHRAPAREKSTVRLTRRGCVRRAAVAFPAIRGARSTVESASLRSARFARASLRTRAGACVGAKLWRGGEGRPMLARSGGKDELKVKTARPSRSAPFFWVHDPCSTAGFSESGEKRLGEPRALPAL